MGLLILIGSLTKERDAKNWWITLLDVTRRISAGMIGIQINGLSGKDLSWVWSALSNKLVATVEQVEKGSPCVCTHTQQMRSFVLFCSVLFCFVSCLYPNGDIRLQIRKLLNMDLCCCLSNRLPLAFDRDYIYFPIPLKKKFYWKQEWNSGPCGDQASIIH